MRSNQVDASPTKGFFIQNLTRDLSLEDAILDLVDNSIDALIRTQELDVSPELLRKGKSSEERWEIDVVLTPEEFSITDRSGGIDEDHARHTVFRLGRPDDSYTSTLGVYGIGFKRAIFKLGENIDIVSRTTTSGFRVAFNVPQWRKDDTTWLLPFERLPPAKREADAGTRIQVRQLNPDVRMRLADGTLLKRLAEFIGSTYTLFLDHFVNISLNGKRVPAKRLPLGATAGLPPVSKSFTFEGVELFVLAGMAERVDDEWVTEKAGWYVLCNGRVVVQADKTDLTGWGISGPQFVSKFRGFLGVAFFFSKDPAQLPWTTTKRGLNRDSAIFQVSRKEMAGLSRPVLDALNAMYKSDPDESAEARAIVTSLKAADLHEAVSTQQTSFVVPVVRRNTKKTTVSVQFDAEKADVDRVKKKLGKPSWSAGAVGRHAFEQYLRAELPK